MKILILSMLFLSSIAKAHNIQFGEINSTWVLYKAGWTQCAIKVLNQNEDQLRIDVTLIAEKTGKTFNQQILLTEEELIGLEHLKYDYSHLEKEQKVPGQFLWTQYQHLVSIHGGVLKYKMTYTETDKDFYRATARLECKVRL